MKKHIVAFALLAICGGFAFPDGPPEGCNIQNILPKGKHLDEGAGDGGFKLCMESAGGTAFTIRIDQTGASASAKINGLRLRPVNSPGTFMQDFPSLSSWLGDVNGGEDCIHHKTKLAEVPNFPNQLTFTFKAASSGLPTIEYYIVAGPNADYWTGNIGSC